MAVASRCWLRGEKDDFEPYGATWLYVAKVDAPFGWPVGEDTEPWEWVEEALALCECFGPCCNAPRPGPSSSPSPWALASVLTRLVVELAAEMPIAGLDGGSARDTISSSCPTHRSHTTHPKTVLIVPVPTIVTGETRS